MWLKILKYAAKAAVASGLTDKALGWIKRKAKSVVDKKMNKLGEKAADVVKDSEEIAKS